MPRDFAPSEALAELTRFMPLLAIATSLRAIKLENDHFVCITTQPGCAESATGAAIEMPGRLKRTAAVLRNRWRVVQFLISPLVTFTEHLGRAREMGPPAHCAEDPRDWATAEVHCRRVSGRPE
ncbi:hypothetical protein IVB14_17265 [Bradyrhizobium sp. 180]|uniref:hypothetical protein n=1 Tax=Bradyrhizobium sp. 180 TaxID=2782650 RepID=UPI001FFA60ED|nr:hypothetical protein [Bradyrhizobium sp. 180]MCK1492121.1 hypothetical protein [Bradyrhizobium sp. 180]